MLLSSLLLLLLQCCCCCCREIMNFPTAANFSKFCALQRFLKRCSAQNVPVHTANNYAVCTGTAAAVGKFFISLQQQQILPYSVRCSALRRCSAQKVPVQYRPYGMTGTVNTVPVWNAQEFLHIPHRYSNDCTTKILFIARE